jgi:hypothetical protein
MPGRGVSLLTAESGLMSFSNHLTWPIFAVHSIARISVRSLPERRLHPVIWDQDLVDMNPVKTIVFILPASGAERRWGTSHDSFNIANEHRSTDFPSVFTGRQIVGVMCRKWQHSISI